MHPYGNTVSTCKALLSLGSNLGNREGFLRAGVETLVRQCGSVLRQSAIYESEVWGTTEQADYLNLALVLETRLSPEHLLRACQEVEISQGRTRERKWGARTLDIDILFYGDEVIQLPQLSIPHPLLTERRFVLEPLAQIAPDWVHPQNGKTVAEMLRVCKDGGWVRKWSS